MEGVGWRSFGKSGEASPWLECLHTVNDERTRSLCKLEGVCTCWEFFANNRYCTSLQTQHNMGDNYCVQVVDMRSVCGGHKGAHALLLGGRLVL